MDQTDTLYYYGVQWPGDTMIRMESCRIVREMGDTFWPANVSDATRLARLLWPLSSQLPDDVELQLKGLVAPATPLPWNRPMRALCAEAPPEVQQAAELPAPIQVESQYTAQAPQAKASQGRASPRVSPSSVEPCLPEMRGNGECDDVCNNEQSQWDGGDCCESTRTGGGRGGRALSGRALSCKDGPYILFLHGANWPVNNTDDWSAQFSDTQPNIVNEVVLRLRMWGRLPYALRDWTRNMVFNLHDTTRYNWSHPRLQRTYYDKAHQIVHDKRGVVIAPAFASLVLAGACLDQGLCNVSWYAVGVPWRGSPVVDMAYLPDTTLPQPTSEATRSLSPLYRNLSTLLLGPIVRQHHLVRGSLCGQRPFGTGGEAGLQLASLAAQSEARRHWQQNTDGIAPLADCQCVGDTRIVDGNHHDVVGMLADETAGGDIISWYRSLLLRRR
jgi:hypothetical protein